MRHLKGASDNRARKKGFVYKKRSPEAVKARSEQRGGRFDSPFKQNVDMYRPKQGDNLFRFLPPGDGHDHYGYEVWMHQYVGPDNSTYICPRKMLNKPCAVCAAATEAKEAGEAEEARHLEPNKRYVSYVLDRDAKDQKNPVPLVFSYSWSQDRDIAALCWDRRTGKALLIDHPEEGYDVSVKRVGSGLGTKYIGLAIDRDPSPLHDDEEVQASLLDYVTENPIPSILHYFDNDYLQKMISGEVDQKDEDEDEERPAKRSSRRRAADEEEEEDEPRGRRRSRRAEPEEEEEEEAPSRRRRARADEEEEEEDERPARRSSSRRRARDEEEDEEEEAPVRRRSRARAEPDEDEEDEEPAPRRRRAARDEEEEEDEEPPARSKRRSRVDEEEEEDEEPAPRRRARGNGRVRDEEEEEEEEDEAPRRRRRASEEEDEDEPAPWKSRRRREVEEDEDEAPARRGGRGRSSRRR